MGLKRVRALNIVGITKHQYYHKPKSGKRGVAASTRIIKHVKDNKVSVANAEVVDEIKVIHSEQDIEYGYQKKTVALNINGFHINYKKVYSLMKESQMLRQKSETAKRKFVKYRILMPSGLLELLKMDIKFLWIESARQHGHILKVLVVFTRQVLRWMAAVSHRIRQKIYEKKS